jgi:hypothetical protein
MGDGEVHDSNGRTSRQDPDRSARHMASGRMRRWIRLTRELFCESQIGRALWIGHAVRRDRCHSGGCTATPTISRRRAERKSRISYPPFIYWAVDRCSMLISGNFVPSIDSAVAIRLSPSVPRGSSERNFKGGRSRRLFQPHDITAPHRKPRASHTGRPAPEAHFDFGRHDGN